MKTGIEIIQEERNRQIDVEKWDYNHDEAYKNGELIGAAACYLVNALNKQFSKPIAKVEIWHDRESYFLVNDGDRGDRSLREEGWVDAWPWDAQYDKREKHGKLRSLQIAAALIVAEIDRMQSAEPIQ